MISRFENNLLGSREVKGLYSEESGGKELDGKGSSLELRPRERGGLKDQSEWNSNSRVLGKIMPMVVYNFSGIPYPTTGQGNTQGGVPNGNNQVRGGPENGGQKNQWKGQQGQNQQGNNWKQQGPTGQRKQGPIICYGCGQPGHFKRQCPFTQRGGTGQQNQGNWVPYQNQQPQGCLSAGGRNSKLNRDAQRTKAGQASM